MGLEPGTSIGGYTILSQLGSGAMGVVYKAIDDGGYPVAFKILRSDVIDREELRVRLVREAAALQKVKHPAVAAMLDAETDSDETFIVTELIEGPTLDSYVADKGPMSPAELLHTARRLAGALSAVHAADVVHRDMKPNNILIGVDGAVLIDFGIAHGMEDSRLTAPGMVIGTPGYLAPELVSGASPSASSDWWGWAAVLTFAATGRPPFGTGGYEPVIARAMTGKADVNGLDRRIAVALRGALAVRPDHRWSTEEVISELENAVLFPDEEAKFVDTSEDVNPTQVLSAAHIPNIAPAAHDQVRRLPDDDATRVTPVGTAVMPQSAVGPNGPGYASQNPAGEQFQQTQQYQQPQYYQGQPVQQFHGEYGSNVEPSFDEQAPEIYRHPVPKSQILIFGVAALAVLALGVRQPYDTLVVMLVVTFIFAVTGATWDAFHTRREVKGATKYEGLVAAVWFPWRIVRSVIGMALTLLISAVVAVPIGAGLLWAFQSSATPDGSSLSDGVYFLIFAVMWIIILVMNWFGPLPRNTREGGRYLMQLIVPGKIAKAVLIVLLAAGVLYGGLTILNGDPIEWQPLQEAPRIP